MKVLFLDIDGVLNHDNTKERIKELGYFTGFLGLDKELVDRYLNWKEGKDHLTVLSSTWRQHDGLREYLLKHGIFFSDVTPRIGFRGNEVESWVRTHENVEKYAILDDNQWFNDDQQPYLVLTDPKVGVTDANLKKVDEILNG